jgi:hypothetical protein
MKIISECPIRMNHKNEQRIQNLKKHLDPECDKIKIHKTKPLNFNQVLNQKKRKAVIIEGTRTPFVKAFGDFLEVFF